jgi:hypothetical protein
MSEPQEKPGRQQFLDLCTVIGCAYVALLFIVPRLAIRWIAGLLGRNTWAILLVATAPIAVILGVILVIRSKP